MSDVRGLAGAAALLLAGFLVPQDGGAPPREPLAAVLAPLGPLQSLATSLLWQRMLTAQMEAEGARTAAFGRALLEMHPDLEVVREYVANQLVVTEAPRAPDLARHDRLVAVGLTLLDEGLARRESPRLHGALGRMLAIQPEQDADFARAAATWLGDDVRESALAHLRASEMGWMDRTLLGGLLLDRAAEGVRDDDLWAARRDWQEALAALAPLRELEGALIDQRLDALARELRDRGVDPAGQGPLREDA